jgi:PAS domain S-box-containing protein
MSSASWYQGSLQNDQMLVACGNSAASFPVSQPNSDQDQLFRELAEHLPIFVWAADGKGAKIFCNRHYLNYVGINSISGMDTSWHESVHVEDRIRAREAWTTAVATGSAYQCEYRLRRYDGIYRHFLARAFPRRDEDGIVTRWLGTSVDVHDQKLAEEAVLSAEKLSTAARFAASMAHEINNPLAAVTNALYLAELDNTLSQKTRSYLDLATRELARVSHVTTRTLGFHNQSTYPSLVNVSELMNSVLVFMRPRRDAAGVTIWREFDSTVELRCFAEDLSQMFASLILNALQASSPGSTIRIRIGRQADPANHRRSGIRILIADSGHGIPMPIRFSIFAPFVSTKGATSNGLGLWMAERIVRKHRGTIRFRTSSTQRHGTVFSVFLPLEEAVTG